MARFHDGDENFFMRNPMLYRIGMDQACFGKMEMAKWILYALWHAFVVFNINFWALEAADSSNSPRQSDGKDFGFWVAGHVLYGSCVFVSNLVLAHKFNIHHKQGAGLLGLMVFAYFFIMFLESQWPFSVTLFADVSHIYFPMFQSILVWLTIGMVLGQVSILELLWGAYRGEKDKMERENFRRSSNRNYSRMKELNPGLN